MFDLQAIGRLILAFGVVLVVVGGLFYLLGRSGLPGNLPGDIRIQRGSWGCYVPLAASVIISLLLTIALNVIARLLK